LKKEKEDADKFKHRDLGNMVRNPSPNNNWKVVGQKYKNHFKREVMASTPAFNETGLITCNKWHIQGFCYKKCERKASNKAFSSATHKASYDKWVKE
jgi:hypothetical protein